jgi:hypothetical protein
VQLRISRSALILCFWLFVPGRLSAQFADLDHLANQLAGKLKPLKPHKVAVALLSDASESVETGYFASVIAGQIEFRGREVHVQDVKSFNEFLAREKISASVISSPESLKALAERDKLDFVLFGTLEKQIADYQLVFKIIRLPGGEVIDTLTSSVPRTEFTESLTAPFPPKTNYLPTKISPGKASPPSCLSCPHS